MQLRKSLSKVDGPRLRIGAGNILVRQRHHRLGTSSREATRPLIVVVARQTLKFAQQMITDHQKTTEDIKKLVASGKVQVMLPTEMISTQTAMLDKLKALNGTDFTAQYHSNQVSAHKDAVDLFTRYGKKGDNAALKDWAAKTSPALQHHRRMAEDLNE